MISKTIDTDIIKLSELVNKKSTPFFVHVIPEEYSLPNECFPSVKEKITRDGGKMIVGWQIWKTQFIVEAEFHAIWKSPSDNFVDITPKQIPTQRILFLPDKKKIFTGKQVDNIRINITKNPLVDDFIEIAKAIFRITNHGELENQLGEVKLIGKSAQIYPVLLEIKTGVYAMMTNGCSRNSLCFCGRDLKYKHCHGKDIRKVIKRL